MADEGPERPAREIAASADDLPRVFTDVNVKLIGGEGEEYTWDMPGELAAIHRVTVLGRKNNKQLVRYLIEVTPNGLSVSRDE